MRMLTYAHAWVLRRPQHLRLRNPSSVSQRTAKGRSNWLTDWMNDWLNDWRLSRLLFCHYSCCGCGLAPAKVHNRDDYYALFSAWHLWAALRISFLQSVWGRRRLLLLAYVRLFPHWLFVCIRIFYVALCVTHFRPASRVAERVGQHLHAWRPGWAVARLHGCTAAWVLWQLLINVEVNVNVRQRRSALVASSELKFIILLCRACVPGTSQPPPPPPPPPPRRWLHLHHSCCCCCCCNPFMSWNFFFFIFSCCAYMLAACLLRVVLIAFQLATFDVRHSLGLCT